MSNKNSGFSAVKIKLYVTSLNHNKMFKYSIKMSFFKLLKPSSFQVYWIGNKIYSIPPPQWNISGTINSWMGTFNQTSKGHQTKF